MKKSLTTAVVALWNSAVLRVTAFFETLEIFFGIGWPAFDKIGAAWLVAEVHADDILAVKLALKVDKNVAIANFAFLDLQSASVLLGRGPGEMHLRVR
jgi:hypothetical protein